MGNFKALCLGIKEKASYHSPEILMTVGALSGACSLIFTAIGTIKAMDTIEDHKDRLDEVKEAKEEMTPKVYKKEIVKTYSKTGLNLSKNYALAAGFGIISVTCYFSAYGILKSRYVTLSAAYTALNASFNAYRKRVIEDKGEDQDIYYMTGVKPKEITVTNEDGTKEKKKLLPVMPNGEIASPYAFKFGKYKENGEHNKQWQDNANLDKSILLGQQDYLNDQLYLRCMFNHNGEICKRGSVMLNEIRDLCGEDPTTTGAIVGNLYSNGEPGCNGYIDFGMVEGKEIDPETGREIPYFWINPNVDGLIYDKLGEFEKVPFKPNDYFERIEGELE